MSSRGWSPPPPRWIPRTFPSGRGGWIRPWPAETYGDCITGGEETVHCGQNTFWVFVGRQTPYLPPTPLHCTLSRSKSEAVWGKGRGEDPGFRADLGVPGFATCLTVGGSLSCSKPQFPRLQDRDRVSSGLKRMSRVLKKMVEIVHQAA